MRRRRALCVLVDDDDAAAVEATVASATPLVDSWVVLDCATSSATEDRVRAALADLPGRWHRRPWRGEGPSRTELVSLARDAAAELLLLDAGMTTELDRPLPAARPATAHLAPCDDWVRTQWPLLLDGHHAWVFTGAARARLESGSTHFAHHLEGVRVHPNPSTFTRSRLERDWHLLQADLRRRPGDPHVLLHLAVVDLRLGRRGTALARLRALVGRSLDGDEDYYARFMLANIETAMGTARCEALARTLVAAAPHRAEGYLLLAERLLATDRAEEAQQFARAGRALPVPTAVDLVHPECYRGRIALTAARAAQAMGRWADAVRFAHDVLSEPGTVGTARTQAHDLVERLLCRPGRRPAAPPPLATLVPMLGRWHVDIATDPPLHAYNPCVHGAADRLSLVVRLSDVGYLDHGPDRRWTAGRWASRALLIELDGDPGDDSLDVASGRLVRDHAEVLGSSPGHARGLEDLRLVDAGGRRLALGTAADAVAPDLPVMVLVDLADDHPLVLPSPRAGRAEKNWMPFARRDALHVVVSVDPLVVHTVHDDGSMALVANRPIAGLGPSWRGGSQGVEVPGGWLFAVHDKTYDDEPRAYVHRFVLVDDDLWLRAATPSFVVDGCRVELITGLARHRGRLLVSVGLEDRSGAVLATTVDAVVDLLEPIEPPACEPPEWAAVLAARGAPTARLAPVPVRPRPDQPPLRSPRLLRASLVPVDVASPR